MKNSILALALVSLLGFLALAETATFTVSGMTCGSCAKKVRAKVCKMEGLESCTVDVGSVVVTTKAGTPIDTKKVEALISSAGEYSVTKTEKK
jgi:copper chaperone CopZ